MPRLRNQVTQLQAANQKLSQQLKATSDLAKQQQAQAEQAEAGGRPRRRWWIAMPASTIFARSDAVKQQWALDKDKTAEAIPTAQDLLPYFKDGAFPVCPSGGTYTLNAVGELPSCSVAGHVLPQ